MTQDWRDSGARGAWGVDPRGTMPMRGKSPAVLSPNTAMPLQRPAGEVIRGLYELAALS